MQIANAWRAIRSARPTCCAAPWARKTPRRWPSSASASSGAAERGFPQKKIEKIFDLMEQFAGYGFNKSHSAAYALLAYHTAYLKTHYPVEFMAALLTSVTGKHRRRGEVHQRVPRDGYSGRTARHQRQRGELHSARRGHPLRPGGGEERRPQRHRVDCRGAQETARFKSFYQFCENVDLRLLNKRVLESLIKSGAMDALGRRAQLMAVVDSAMEHAQKAQQDAALGQHGLFGVFRTRSRRGEKPLPDTPDWDEHAARDSKKKSWASSSPAIRWKSIATSCSTSTRSPPLTSAT